MTDDKIEPGDHALFLALRYIRFATARRVRRAAMTARSLAGHA